MRTFGWDPSEEDLKDMVNVIDQVDITLYWLHIKLYLCQFVLVFEGHGQCECCIFCISICNCIDLYLHMYQFAFVFEGHGQCHRSGGYNFVFAACQFVFVSICVCVWRTWSVLSIRWTKVVITAYQVSDALASLNFISESISNSLKLLSWKGKCAKVLNNCWVCISRTAMATSVSTSLSGWWRGEPTTTAYAFKLINQLLQSFQTKPLLQMGPAGRRALRLSFCRWKIWKDQGVQRFRHRGGSSRGF